MREDAVNTVTMVNDDGRRPENEARGDGDGDGGNGAAGNGNGNDDEPRVPPDKPRRPGPVKEPPESPGRDQPPVEDPRPAPPKRLLG